MSTIKILDADGAAVYLNGEGAGTVGDPFNPKQVVETIHRDQTTEDVSHFLTRLLDTFTIDTNRTLDDYSFSITTTGVTPVAGDMACFKEGSKFLQAEILTVTPITGDQYTIDIDKPLNYAYTTSAICELGNKNLASGTSAATIAAPIQFRSSPAGMAAGTAWDICRMIIVADDGTVVDDWSEFVNLTALTNGILLRVENSAGRRETLGVFKSNLDFAAEAYDADLFALSPASGGAMKVRSSFNGNDKRGVVKRLTADDSDEFSMYVRDNITAVDNLFIKIQGHFVD